MSIKFLKSEGYLLRIFYNINSILTVHDTMGCYKNVKANAQKMQEIMTVLTFCLLLTLLFLKNPYISSMC